MPIARDRLKESYEEAIVAFLEAEELLPLAQTHRIIPLLVELSLGAKYENLAEQVADMQPHVFEFLVSLAKLCEMNRRALDLYASTAMVIDDLAGEPDERLFQEQC